MRWKKLKLTVPYSLSGVYGPDEVLPEWEKQRALLGDDKDVARFVQSALYRLNAPLEAHQQNTFKLMPQYLPALLKERFEEEGLTQARVIDFTYPPAPGAQYVHRSHVLVTLLADALLEGALSDDKPLAARAAATVTADANRITTLYLLRLRHQLTVTYDDNSKQLIAEESIPLAFQGRSNPELLSDADAHRLLNATPSANLKPEIASREVRIALDFLEKNKQQLDDFAHQRAQILLEDHTRVREASRGQLRVREVARTTVKPCLPVDIIGVYVLLPDEL